ncbi:MAG: OmpA family protein, partial [Nitrospirae bacterium]|nr:OmpA family protein [Nitrospirota bacterium]
KLRNVRAAEPEGHQTQIFTIGSIGPKEKLTLQYQMIVGSGVRIGQDYNNRAIAKEDFTVPIASKAGSAIRAMSVCDLCALSNTDEVTVKLVFDPIFDLGTIIGKVFYDTNRDGFQDRGENGVAGAMVALDDGTYAVTDADGRYHFPGVRPGQRLVKINLASISPEPVATTEEARVVQVTSGLLAKVNFGVIYDYDDASISRKGIPGLGLDARSETEPIKVIGSTETMTLLMNGAPVTLPGSEVRLGAEDLSETVEMKGHKLTSPITFDLQIDSREEVRSWTLTVYDPRGKVFHRIRKTGPPPVVLKWNGKGFGKKLVRAGEVYQYVLEVIYTDGSRAESSRRLFGVNRTEAISLNLTGSAFEVGKATLSDEAKNILHEAAATLRQYPDEKVIIEGHADAIGTSELNMKLSKERAESALDYLIHEEKIPADRFVMKWYGETQPLASNELEEGREINRRVEISGQVKGKQEAKILDQLRTPPEVRLNDLPLEVQPDGRFQAEIPDAGLDQVRIQVKNEQGREVETTIPLPQLTILDPVEPRSFALGEEGDGYRVDVRETDGEKPVIHYRLRGRTDPANTLVMDGRPVPLQSDGTFEIPVELAVGRNVFGLVVRSPLTAARIVKLVIQVADRDEDGRLKMAVAPIPYLEVQFPAHGKPLREDRVPIIGRTSPENRITVNGVDVLVQSDGRFTTILTLPRGKSTPVRVEVTDPSGYTGMLEREITVSGSDLFFLALADGEVGQLHTKGYLAGAGQSEEKDYYSQGRIAYYFKGTVLGKYLVTSAFDTGKREFNRMFTDLDRKETDRLFTNLDPDKYYPIYGDDSQVVYDAQSLGRFYLAVDSEEFHALIGDFPVGMNETELAAYNRTLYGGRVQYRSLSRTAYGAPMTEVTVFGAEVRTANAHNEFRGTGGSLYYVSHDRITEGSEQVRIEVR